MESKVRIRARRGRIEAMVLNSLILAGALTLAVAAPNTVQLLKHVDLQSIMSRDPRQRLRETASRLKRKGLIRFESRDGRTFLTLTTKGKQVASRVHAGEYVIKTPRRWDQRWRIVTFDIPEKKRPLREKTRRLVRELGFYRLQDSVWVHPYDCEEIVTILKSDLQLGRELLYVIADAIEYDAPLRQHFKL